MLIKQETNVYALTNAMQQLSNDHPLPIGFHVKKKMNILKYVFFFFYWIVIMDDSVECHLLPILHLQASMLKKKKSIL